MYRYAVADTNASALMIALRDADGTLHIARVQYTVPEIGDEFSGAQPRPGLHALIDSAGAVFRVTFDQVNCSQAVALERLHGAPRR